jgi:hypothetical protein
MVFNCSSVVGYSINYIKWKVKLPIGAFYVPYLTVSDMTRMSQSTGQFGLASLDALSVLGEVTLFPSMSIGTRLGIC